ncbi:MAG: hypothetical protein B6D64_06255 [Bacteroidetes bacterium 4484_276]|nr:MAG: hypothetical protein B6D64_06255 [Bacteroidetes bacterium 4484_276]
MLSFEPNIIVVDDKEEEVKGIITHYLDQGIGCKFYNADYVEGNEMPDKPYSDVSLIFLDLFYNENFDAEQCSNWIKSLIFEKIFYVLIIWSKDPSQTDEVYEELKKINRIPFLILKKNKADYPPKDDLKFDFSKLFDEIIAELEKTPSLKEIGIWKKSVKLSSNIVVGSLITNADLHLFNSKLQKIIVAHGGMSILSSDDNIRKRNILFEALDQILIANTNNSFPVDKVDNINQEELYKIPKNIQVEIDRELNSWFHFKLQKEIPDDIIIPGLICENIHSLFTNLYSIQDDPKLSLKLAKQIESESTNIIDIVVVLTRPCDIAQSKFGKNIKLLSGIKISNPYRYRKDNLSKNQKRNKNRYLGNIHFNGQEMPDSIKLYDHLHFSNSDNDIAILFDLRYVFSVPEKIFIDHFRNLKVFNKELLSEMQVEYSNYSSRLGITQII